MGFICRSAHSLLADNNSNARHVFFRFAPKVAGVRRIHSGVCRSVGFRFTNMDLNAAFGKLSVGNRSLLKMSGKEAARGKMHVIKRSKLRVNHFFTDT